MIAQADCDQVLGGRTLWRVRGTSGERPGPPLSAQPACEVWARPGSRRMGGPTGQQDAPAAGLRLDPGPGPACERSPACPRATGLGLAGSLHGS